MVQELKKYTNLLYTSPAIEISGAIHVINERKNCSVVLALYIFDCKLFMKCFCVIGKGSYAEPTSYAEKLMCVQLAGRNRNPPSSFQKMKRNRTCTMCISVSETFFLKCKNSQSLLFQPSIKFITGYILLHPSKTAIETRTKTPY